MNFEDKNTSYMPSFFYKFGFNILSWDFFMSWVSQVRESKY